MHHAYLLVGEKDSAEDFLHSFWNERKVKLKGNPDFFSYLDPLFGIDEARELREKASLKAFTDKKIFFLAPERITAEAQNALLKTFEDPIENTYFFLFAREEELILPTLRSRMQSLHLEKGGEKQFDASKFLNLSYKDRIAFAKKFSDSEENLSVFLDELLTLLRKDKKGSEAVRQVYESRRFSDDRAASARLILEHLSLVL